jgi:hypothetical protein
LVRRRNVAPAVLQNVFVNATTEERLRIAVVRRCAELGGVARVMPSVAQAWWPTHYAWPLTYADDAVMVQKALRSCLRVKERKQLLGGYLRLAQLAGPEPVWALELEYVGSVELMDPAVRFSLQMGSADVLLMWLQ